MGPAYGGLNYTETAFLLCSFSRAPLPTLSIAIAPVPLFSESVTNILLCIFSADLGTVITTAGNHDPRAKV